MISENKNVVGKTNNNEKNNTVAKFIIIFDINGKNPKEYNRIKRLFYYHLLKIDYKPINKSVFLTDFKNLEKLKLLLKRFRKNIKAYVIEASTITKL